MTPRRRLLRGAAVLALAAVTVGTGLLAPTVSAAPPGIVDVAETVKSTVNKPKVDGDPDIPGIGEIPGLSNIGSGGTDVGNIPIIGDVANTFKDAEPEEIVTGAIQFAGIAAERIVPLIRGLAK